MENEAIEDLENKRKKFEELSDRDPDSKESKKAYHEWYDAACVLFNKYFDLSDENFVAFRSVDNKGVARLLRYNYDNVRSNYAMLLDQTKSINQKIMMNNNNVSTKNVFIVHGHDNEMKETVARFLIGLKLNPIILHERPNKNRTIIAKLIEESKTVIYAVILYSPCDRGKAKYGKKYKPRARQNVIFEHGFLMGRLGEHKVCCLHRGTIEMPSDNDGVLYIEFDANGGWKENLVREMKAAGLTIDANDIF